MRIPTALTRTPFILRARTLACAIAVTAAFGAVHRRPGSPAPKTADFLLFRDAWADTAAPDSGRYSDLDLEIMRQLRR